MLCNVSFSAIWRALFVAPLFLTGRVHLDDADDTPPSC